MNLPQKKSLTLKTASDPSAIDSSQAAHSDKRTQPIPPPSHPRQYRAIGLVRGKYRKIEEQITQGKLITSDGTEIEAVLLGRVISLVKKHLDLEQEHLWVVYPRTKVKSDCLHLQILGVWEPETLSQDEKEANAALSSEEIKENSFSIRGEVVFYDREKEVVVVKIKQFPRKEGDKPKSFKLKLKGVLEGKPLRHFWDLNANLEGETLIVPSDEATDLGFAQKKPRFQKKPSKKFSPPRKTNTNNAISRPKPKIDKPTKNSN